AENRRQDASHACGLQRLRRKDGSGRHRDRTLARQCRCRKWNVQRQSRKRPVPQAERVCMKPIVQTSPGRDFIELREDISSSPLWNRDLAPTTIRQRTWSTWNIAALWIGMSVVITTYTLAGGFIEAGMNWWQAMITILSGNTIVLLPMILNAHAGTKYGVSFPVLCRASFGTRGA